MIPFLSETFGNAASRNHRFGWDAEGAVTEAREKCARVLGARPKEIIFTSGATESINLALKGAARANMAKGRHIISTTVEHRAVLDTLAYLGTGAFDIELLPVDSTGAVSTQQIKNAIREDTVLLSVIFANNEVGTINPVAEIGSLCRDAGVIFHTDATQAIGKEAVNVEEMKIDLLSFSGHKFYGPKGVGGCYIRRQPKVEVEPLFHGGGHERGYRSGTLNVAGIAGMGKAIELAEELRVEEHGRITLLRNRLKKGLLERDELACVNGPEDDSFRLAGNLNISFPYVEGEALMMSVPDIAVSSGSACTSAKIEPSHVLKALGLEDEMVHSSIRFGLGRDTTEDEIDYVIERFTTEVVRLREISPKYEAYKRSGNK